MIVYDKKQKQIVIPSGIGNLNLFNNGVEVGYEQGKIDGINIQKAKLESINITENGTYSIDDQETVRSIAFDGYSYFNTGIFPTENIKIEACIKITNGNNSGLGGIIIGGGIGKLGKNTENRGIAIGMDGGGIYGIWGAIKSRNKPYKREGEGTTTVVLQKTDDSWVWDGEKGSFGASGLYIGGYNSDDIAVEKKFLQSIVYIKIWTDRNDDSTLITYTPKTNGNFDANGIELQRLGDGTTTFVKETVKKYPYGFKKVDVNVPDLNGSYDEGYAQGKTDGINEQKSKLESINITENGTYRKEDGYNEIVVDVPDLNGSYDEGYEQGQADVAANARVLEVTKNGNYLSKFSDPVIPTLVTGVYANGTKFYSYAKLGNKVFNTNITPTPTTRLELWYKGDNTLAGDAWNVIIGAEKIGDGSGYQIRYDMYSNSKLRFELGRNNLSYTWDENAWHHILIAKETENASSMSLWVDEVKIGNFGNTPFNPQSPFYINCIESNTDLSRNANGYFGMIKIDDVIIIPTADGFLNTNTGELLEVVKDGSYIFTENKIRYGEGELYKTINVDVIPKINVQKAGLKFGESKFKEVPEWADFEGITDMSSMFRNCQNLQTIPQIDTSNVTDANNMFYTCNNLKTLPNNFNFGICTNFGGMFNYTPSLTDYSFLETWVFNPDASMDNMINNTNTTYVPAIPCVGNTSYYQSAIFWSTGVFSKLTYFGGWIGRKYNVNKDNMLKKMPNLTYESCISILNNLYDFTGNGETPNSSQGKLKVAQSFIDKVGEEISIGINKGWQITV